MICVSQDPGWFCPPLRVLEAILKPEYRVFSSFASPSQDQSSLSSPQGAKDNRWDCWLVKRELIAFCCKVLGQLLSAGGERIQDLQPFAVRIWFGSAHLLPLVYSFHIFSPHSRELDDRNDTSCRRKTVHITFRPSNNEGRETRDCRIQWLRGDAEEIRC